MVEKDRVNGEERKVQKLHPELFKVLKCLSIPLYHAAWYNTKVWYIIFRSYT